MSGRTSLSERTGTTLNIELRMRQRRCQRHRKFVGAWNEDDFKIAVCALHWRYKRLAVRGESGYNWRSYKEKLCSLGDIYEEDLANHLSMFSSILSTTNMVVLSAL